MDQTRVRPNDAMLCYFDLYTCHPPQALIELACAYSACEVARASAAQAFQVNKRGMLAGDVLNAVATVFDEFFPVDGAEPEERQEEAGGGGVR